jgi:hypothetical protein
MALASFILAEGIVKLILIFFGGILALFFVFVLKSTNKTDRLVEILVIF